MNIWSKIEKIRQQPEHIRLRYVWGCVTASMVFVVAIWTVSFRSENISTKGGFEFTQDQTVTIEKLGEQKRSLEETGGTVKKALEQAQVQGQAQAQSKVSAEQSPEGFGSNIPIQE